MLGDSARHRLLPAIAGCIMAAVVAGCGGGGPDHELSRSLQKRLPAKDSVEGFVQQRTFDWTDPVNLVGEGLFLPEATRPSQGVKVLRDAGIEAGSGERFEQGLPPDSSYVTFGVVKLASEAKARKVQAWLHRQGLQPPCFADCLYQPKDLAVPGVPHVTAVQQVPGPAPDHVFGPTPPTHYRVEFVVGPYLYFGLTDGAPQDVGRIVAGAQKLYKSVRTFDD